MEATPAPAWAASLKQAVDQLKTNPDLLHDPSLAFFKTYLESLGAKVPAPAATVESDDETDDDKPDLEDELGGKASHVEEEEDEEEEAEEEEEEEDEPDDQIMPRDEPPYPPMEADGAENEDKATEFKIEASDAFDAGDFAKAVEKYSEAIKLGASGALVHAKRARALLKLKRPYAAKLDCDKALEINSDSATAYKVRGMAHRYMGEYEKAAEDLRQGQKIDYDDATEETHKYVESRIAKVVAKRRANERKEADKKLKEAQKAKARAQAQREQHGSTGGMGGMGGMPQMEQLLSDPEIMLLMSKPNVMAAMTAMSQNPGSLNNYMGDPDVRRLMEKFSESAGMRTPGAEFRGEPDHDNMPDEDMVD